MALKTAGPEARVKILAKYGGRAKSGGPVKFARKPSRDENGLNKLEAAWRDELTARGHEVGIHRVTFKIGDDCRYTPDFDVLTDGRWVFYETKGFMRDDALVKLKVVARQHPQVDFVLVTREKGQWVEVEVRA